jgi:pimeloyl-ACP methyl ester carboxylesterase
MIIHETQLSPALEAQQLYARLRDGPIAPPPPRAQDAALLARCREFRFGTERELVGWSVGEGPPVLLLHGWGGLGVQMAKLALAAAERGFRAVFCDVAGHGLSASKPLGFDRFMDDAQALQHATDPSPHAWIGHSAGALALLSARRTHGIRALRYVAIAAPCHPYVPVDRLRGAGVREAVLDELKRLIAAQFSAPWAALEAGAAWQPGASARLLLAYDEDDEVVHPCNGDKIQSVWPGATRLRTRGFGHNRLLGSPALIEAALDHLSD